MNQDQKINSWLRMAVVFSMTLGLAPFFPEPHIWGKILWIKGGAVGMQALDWFDFFFHGAPWFLLIGLIVYKLYLLKTAKNS